MQLARQGSVVDKAAGAAHQRVVLDAAAVLHAGEGIVKSHGEKPEKETGRHTVDVPAGG